MHNQQILFDHQIDAQHMRIYEPQSCPIDLQKAPMNNLNNPILLLFRHLIIGRQAQSSPENIRSNILESAGNISICAAPAVSGSSNKRVRPIYRLHVHGLPNRYQECIIHPGCSTSLQVITTSVSFISEKTFRR